MAARAGYGASGDEWSVALASLGELTASGANRAQRGRGLDVLRALIDPAGSGPLDLPLQGALADAVRLSKPSTSNADDNKIIRAALAAATVAARVAPPADDEPSSTGASTTVEGAAAALAAAKGGLMSSAPPVWHRTEAARSAIACCASRFDALREGAPLGAVRAAARESGAPPEGAVSALRSLAAEGLRAATGVQDAAAKAVASGRAGRALRVAGGAGPAVFALAALGPAAADLARCAGAAAADAQLRLDSDGAAPPALSPSDALASAADAVLGPCLACSVGGVREAAGRAVAALAWRAEARAAAAAACPGPRPLRRAHAAAALVMLTSAARALSTGLALPAAAMPSPPEAVAASMLARSACGLASPLAPTPGSAASASAAAVRAAVAAAPTPDAADGSPLVVAQCRAAARAAALGAAGEPAPPLVAAGADAPDAPGRAVTQAVSVLLVSAEPSSRDATPAAAELLGAGGAWGSGTDRAAAAALGAVPAELAVESMRASGSVDPLLLRAATASAARAVAAVAAMDADLRQSLGAGWTGHALAAARSVHRAWALLRRLDPSPPALARLRDDAAAAVDAACDEAARFASAAGRAAALAAEACVRAAEAAASGSDGSVRGSDRIETARRAAAVLRPLLLSMAPPTPVARLTADAMLASAVLRRSGSAEADAWAGIRAAAGWAAAATAERSPRSLVLARSMARAVTATAAALVADEGETAAGRALRSGGLAGYAAPCGGDATAADELLGLVEGLCRAALAADTSSGGAPSDPRAGTRSGDATSLAGGGAPLAAEACLLCPLLEAAASVVPAGSSGSPALRRLLAVAEEACCVPGVDPGSVLAAAAGALCRRGGAAAALGASLASAAESLE